MVLDCPTNFAVACGSTNWSFGTPSVVTNCCANVTNVSTIVTNGMCQQLITETWLYSDACGDSSICSQTVTVECCTNTCTATTIVNGASGPWDVSLNSGFFYGVPANGQTNFDLPPTVVDCSSGLAFSPGDTLTISSLTPGQATLSPGDGLWCDANGEISLGPSTVGGPGVYISETVYLEELVGTFAWNGVIVGTPFAIGNGTTVTIPSGANQLLLGVVDGWYNDNGGSVGVSITGVCSNACTNACISLACPSDIVVTSCVPIQEFYAPTVTDTCCSNGSVTVTCTPPSGSIFYPNTATPVICVATDSCSNSSTCSFTVTVLCNTNGCTNGCINLVCPNDMAVTSCIPTQVYYTPTVTDTCCSNGTVTVVCTPPSGTSFAPNTATPVICVATDSCSNSCTCSFTVTVLCNTNGCTNGCINLVCPINMVVTSCVPIQEFYSPTVTDTCCSNVTVVCTPPSGSTFAPNTATTVNCMATDSCSNSCTCSFTVTVIQAASPPIITSYPTNITICANTQVAGVIIVDSDEWIFSDDGFAAEGDGAVYTINCATYLTGGRGTNILIYSDNFSFTGNTFQQTLIQAGYAVTQNTPLTPALTLPYLLQFNAVFLGGDMLTSDELLALEEYICAGGGVYIAAGAMASAPQEAGLWNPLLNQFGLNISNAYNNIGGPTILSVNDSTLILGSSPIVAGVTNIEYNLGQDVSITGGNPVAQVVAFDGAHGLIGVSGCITWICDGCGPMPNATGQVQVSGGGNVTQSIPPGTILCTGTNVTFTASNNCGEVTMIAVPCSLTNCASSCLQILCPINMVVTFLRPHSGVLFADGHEHLLQQRHRDGGLHSALRQHLCSEHDHDGQLPGDGQLRQQQLLQLYGDGPMLLFAGHLCGYGPRDS